MTLVQPTKGYNCCCPDCIMHEDWFDCCFNNESPGIYLPVEYCNVSDIGPVACCLDPNNEFIAKDTYDLGPAWEVVSGTWRKGLSPDPLYTVWDSPCNDGALYCDAAGTVRCKVGWKNDGYACFLTVIDEDVGLDFTISLDDGPGTTANTTLRYQVGAYSPENGGNKVTLTLNGSKSYVTYHAPLGPLNPHCRYTIYLAVNGLSGLTGAGFGPAIAMVPELFLCEGSGGKKVAITVNSLPASGRPAVFDNFQWGKLNIYAGRNDLSCFNFMRCGCIDSHGWRRPYGPFDLDIVMRCNVDIPTLPETSFHLRIGLKQDYEYCHPVNNRWHAFYGGGEDWGWHYIVYCEGTQLTVTVEYVDELGNVTPILGGFAVPKPIDDCSELIDYTHPELHTLYKVMPVPEGCVCATNYYSIFHVIETPTPFQTPEYNVIVCN